MNYMNAAERILDVYIKTNKIKKSSKRTTILKVLQKLKGHFDINELYKESKKQDPSIGVATIYRAVKIFKACGLLDEHNFDGKQKFEFSYKKAHHDHLACIECNTIIEFHHPLIEKYQDEIACFYKFFVDSHEMIIYGICRECKNRKLV